MARFLLGFVGGVLVLAALVPAAAGVPQPAPVPSVSYSLYGSASEGWGFDNATMTTPGPTLTAALNSTVTIDLHSADGLAHEWFLDYNGNEVLDSGEPASGVVNGTQVVIFSFVPNILGVMMYRCAIHPSTMYGTFQVVVGDRMPPSITVVSSLVVPVGQPIPVDANVSDASGIQEAILYYKVGTGGPQWMVMNGTGSGLYRATLPAQGSPTTVTFYIAAIDGAGNTGRSPSNGTYTITVGPSGIMPLPTAGLGASYLALLVAVVAVGAAAVVFAARRFGRRPPGRAPEERPGNP